jgi:cyanophycinase
LVVPGAGSPETGDVRERVSSLARLPRLFVGNPADAQVATSGGALLMGGGQDVDDAFRWMLARCAGGDVVVLRTAGTDAYNRYLFSLGHVDSVETLFVSSRETAADPRIAMLVRQAEAIFITGGDQAEYIRVWAGTPLVGALGWAVEHGAVIGGTSAGLMVLSEFVFAASAGTVSSTEALADPYSPRVTLVRSPFPLAMLHDVISDSHFAARDRMGRLVAFMARCVADGWSAAPRGLGVDEATALLVEPDGRAAVVGAGAVYALDAVAGPESCRPGQPLTWRGVRVARLRNQAVLEVPTWTAEGADVYTISAVGGVLSGDTSSVYVR